MIPPSPKSNHPRTSLGNAQPFKRCACVGPARQWRRESVPSDPSCNGCSDSAARQRRIRAGECLQAPTVAAVAGRAGVLLLLTWVLVGYCGWRLTTIGADFLPPFDEGTVQVNVTLPAGASLDASNQASAMVDAKLRSLQKSPTNPNGEVLAFLRRSGRAELDEHAEPPNANEFFVVINPESGKSRKEIIKKLQDEVKEEVPGVDVEVEQPLAHLISHMISGSTAQIAIKLYGDDLDTLEKVSNEIRAAVGGVPGVSSLAVEPIRKVDEVHIKLRPEALALYGVDRAYVGNFVQVALNGEVVSQVVEGQRRFDLLVRLEEPYRRIQVGVGIAGAALDAYNNPIYQGVGGDGEAVVHTPQIIADLAIV